MRVRFLLSVLLWLALHGKGPALSQSFAVENSENEETIFDVGGIDFPALPSLRDFNGTWYLESTKVPTPLPAFTPQERQRLRLGVIQIAAYVKAASPSHDTFSTNAPLWGALVHYFPSLKNPDQYRLLVADGQVSILKLQKHLLEYRE